MRTRYRKIAIVGLIAGGALTAAILLLLSASRQVPDFYGTAIAIPAAQQVTAGYELERQVMDLHNKAMRTGRWETRISVQQINGWLAVDLPKKFPGLLPPQVVAPRVAIEEGRFLLACRYNGSRMSTVVSLVLEVGMTEQPNTVSIRIHRARAGLIPLPLRPLTDKIADVARRAEVTLHWQQDNGDPVALVTIPTAVKALGSRQLTLDRIRLGDGELFIAGWTKPKAKSGQATPASAPSHN